MQRAKQAQNEFVVKMFATIKTIPIEHIVGRFVELHPRGRHYLGLCPFHPDQHYGSFVVTPDKNIWTCFAEGIGGNGIKFYMLYFNIDDYLEAAFKLAVDFGIIKQTEYNYYSKKKYDESSIQQFKKIIEEKPKEKPYTANAEICDLVYKAIAKVCRLSKKHKEQLLKERRLKKNDLDEYFSFPTKNMDLAHKVYIELSQQEAQKRFHKPINQLSREELGVVQDSMAPLRKELPYVPGFYYDIRTKKIDFVSFKGIGFLVKNEKGMVNGIQIRRDTIRPGESRYIWFSSSFAISDPYMQGGASSKSPGGVIFPKKDNGKNAVCLTEGRFKAEKIADAGNTAIYVSGVSTWRSILPILKNVSGNKRSVYLMYDSDLLGNYAVHTQLDALDRELEEEQYHVKIILWSKSLGKGFDDLVINQGSNYYKYLKQMNYRDFEKMYICQQKKALKECGADSVQRMEAKQALAFTTCLQCYMEKALCLQTV